MNQRASPRETLARNLRHLMDSEGLSEAQVAKRTGVSQKAVNKILNQDSAATIETADKLAVGFGLALWQIILPTLPSDRINSNKLSRLYQDYATTTPEGRDYISSVAEREATYKTHK